MATDVFTPDALRRILLEAAGADEAVDLDGDILDTDFTALGYESLALLETVGRIEREYGVSLDDDVLSEAPTPRTLVDLVNERLSAARAA
ncbi:acyl carrier protein [Streptomyces sp. NPDC046870]|uniref:acyl carrier protein n=1 Tax=Streptomyces sp. NPDC046870 TaxID=3155135 RepID=UPI003454E4B5